MIIFEVFPSYNADMIISSWFAQNSNLVSRAICSMHGVILMYISSVENNLILSF